MNRASRLDLIQNLREQSRRIESAARSHPMESVAPESGVLDRLLLDQDFEPGTLVEWLNDRDGSGAVTLALAVAGRILRRGGAFVVIDGAREFYPPAAAGLGIPLERAVIVRPPDPLASLWAWEQSLRCPAVAVTFGRIEGLTVRLFHRLQLAAETGGGLGFLLRSASSRAAPLKAAVRLRVAALPSLGPLHPLDRRLRVELLHCRGGIAGATVEVEMDHETSDVRVAAPSPMPVVTYA